MVRLAVYYNTVSCWYPLKSNTHPCGFYRDVKMQCRCSVKQIEKYRQRISGPLLMSLA
ncbi:MAG: ATP-binding protein [Akkermansiaceae bacterium]